MNITSAGAPPLPGGFKAPSGGLILPKIDRKEVAAGAGKALSSPLMSRPNGAKDQARARVQQIVERLKVLKKLFAFDPKKMARALAQVFKELKAAVKDYARAGGDELALAGQAAGAVTAQTAASPATSQADTSEEADTENPTQAVGALAEHALYDAVVGEVRKTIGEDGLQFIKEIRALSNEISGLLETARTQARGRKRDKDTDNALEDAGKALEELRQSMAETEQDIHVAVPTAGIRLSVAA